MRHYFLLLCVCLIFPTASFAQDDLQSEVDSYLSETFGTERQGIAALIVRDGEVLYNGAVGYDDVEARRPLSPAQPFQIGSVTKPLVAATILRLADQGQLSLDASAKSFLPDIVNDERITVRQLLTHSSGLVRHYPDGPEIMMRDDRLRSLDELLALTRDDELLFEPGTSQMYSSNGYVWLGGIIEKVTGRPWHQVVADEVLKPAGVDSLYFQPERLKIVGLVTGYLSNGKPFAPQAKYYVYQDPAAGFAGTLDGLAKWYAALFDGRILSPESLSLMTTPLSAEEGGLGQIGAGLIAAQVGDAKASFHTGRVPGYASVVMYFPDEDLFVGAFSNDDATMPPLQPATVMLAAMALDTPLDEGRRAEAADKDVQSWYGQYRSGDETMQFFEGGQFGFVLEREGGAAEPFVDAGNGVLLSFDAGSRWAVRDLDEQGTPTIRWNVAGEEETVWTRIGDIPETETVELTAEQRSALVGTYMLPIGPFEVAPYEDDQLQVHPPGMNGGPAKALSPTRLQVDGIGIVIDFTIGEDGRASAILISMGNQTIGGERVD